MIDLESRIRAMRWLLWGFRGSVLLYGAIGLLLRRAIEPWGGLVNLPDAAYNRVLIALAVISAISLALFMFLIPTRLVDPERLVHRAEMNRLSAVVARLQRAFMIAISSAHFVALLGLGLFLLNGRLLDMGVFILAALIGLMITTPREERWQEVIDAVRARRSDWADVW